MAEEIVGTYLTELDPLGAPSGSQLYGEKNGAPVRLTAGGPNALAVTDDDGVVVSDFSLPGTGVARPLASKLQDTVSIKDFGAAGDGVTDDTVAVQKAEAGTHQRVDLLGLTVKTTLSANDLTKSYFNGTLLVLGSSDHAEILKPATLIPDYAIDRPRTKSPVLAWDDLNVLWLGTSIPHQGAGSSDSYPDLFADALGCVMDNQAWSGSHAIYNVTADPFSIGTVKALSMTEDDRLAGVAAHGSSSAYDDTFDPVTKASNMTCDARIRDRFTATAFDVVVLDHNHNDRIGEPGTLAPESTGITAISKGATTVVTLASIGTIAVGDAVALEVEGIDYLNHAAARVQAVAGNQITLNINSSGFAGVFTAGVAYKLDRATIYGAWEFLIHYIKNQGIRAGKDTKVILAGAPSEYTNGVKDNAIFSVGRHIKAVADKWQLAFFDIGYLYQVGPDQHSVYFPDQVHPNDLPTRQALANHWVQWARGGAPYAQSLTAHLPRGGETAFANNREALYSDFTGGFSTPGFVLGAFANALFDFFDDGTYAPDWTVSGVAPSVVAAPWNASDNALKCTVDAANPTSAIYKAVTLESGMNLGFRLWLPETSGLTDSGGTKTVTIASLSSNATGRYLISLLVSTTAVNLRVQYSPELGQPFVSVPVEFPQLDPDTIYDIEVIVVKASASYKGGAIVRVNGAQVSLPIDLDDSAWASTPNRLYIGLQGSTTGKALTAYLDTIVLQEATAHDYSDRYTGSFTTNDGKTVTVVNGMIVSAS